MYVLDSVIFEGGKFWTISGPFLGVASSGHCYFCWIMAPREIRGGKKDETHCISEKVNKLIVRLAGGDASPLSGWGSGDCRISARPRFQSTKMLSKIEIVFPE